MMRVQSNVSHISPIQQVSGRQALRREHIHRVKSPWWRCGAAAGATDSSRKRRAGGHSPAHSGPAERPGRTATRRRRPKRSVLTTGDVESSFGDSAVPYTKYMYSIDENK